MTNTFRPRLSREQRDSLTDIAEHLNGAEVATVSSALDIVLAYHDVLQNNVSCPECGESPIDQTSRGKWQCWHCNEIVTVYDLLDTENSEQATLPYIPRH